MKGDGYKNMKSMKEQLFSVIWDSFVIFNNFVYSYSSYSNIFYALGLITSTDAEQIF